MPADTVVYIDDEDALCDLFALSLNNCGFQVKTFSNPARALEFINSNPVRIVFCDHQMPGISGRQLSLSLSMRLPFYLVTGDIALTLESLKEHGILKILYKPINYDEIRSIIETHFSSEDNS